MPDRLEIVKKGVASSGEICAGGSRTGRLFRSTERIAHGATLTLRNLLFIFLHESLAFMNLLDRHLLADVVPGIERLGVAMAR
jgi:hypothetical protein